MFGTVHLFPWWAILCCFPIRLDHLPVKRNHLVYDKSDGHSGLNKHNDARTLFYTHHWLLNGETLLASVRCPLSTTFRFYLTLKFILHCLQQPHLLSVSHSVCQVCDPLYTHRIPMSRVSLSVPIEDGLVILISRILRTVVVRFGCSLFCFEHLCCLVLSLSDASYSCTTCIPLVQSFCVVVLLDCGCYMFTSSKIPFNVICLFPRMIISR